MPASLRLSIAALSLASLSLSSACVSDEDCGLLGSCTAGACDCDPGWVGATCASLDLVPAPPDAGLRQQNSSNWCLTLLRDPDDEGLFHGLSADFGGCADGLSIWLTGSRIIHATASSPVGPFVPAWADGAAEVAVSGEAHNPQALRTPDGTFLLLDSYAGPDAGCDLEADYDKCASTGGMCKPKMPPGGGVGRFIFHEAATPAGPWAPVNVTCDYPCFSQNLTPSPFFHPNGTLFVVFHCDSGGAHKMGDLVMVRADSWRDGPFERVNDGVWSVGDVGPHPEDPFAFLHTNSKTGELSWHVILHNNPEGLHLFSRDGLNFTLQQSLAAPEDGSLGAVPQPPYVFPPTVAQTDGTNFTAGRRERPWILWKANTTCVPEVLVTSMEAHSVSPVVFSHAQAVRS